MTSADYDLQIQARLPVADIEVFLSFIDMNKWNRIQQYEAYNYAIIKYMQNDISFLYRNVGARFTAVTGKLHPVTLPYYNE